MKSAKDEKKSRRLTKSVLYLFVRGGYHRVIIFSQVKEFGDGAKPSCVIFHHRDQAFRPLIISEEDAPFLIHGIKEIANIRETEIGKIPIKLRDEFLDLTLKFVVEVRVVNDKESEKLVLSVMP